MKTTEEAFAIYKRGVLKYLKLYGLIGWDAVVVHGKVANKTLAQMDNHPEARSVVFTLNTDVVDDYEEDDAESSAFHEVLELLFDKLESMVCEHKKDEAREEVHHIIQTLNNVRKSNSNI